MSQPVAFDPLAALRALTSAGVDFVVIGGVAARLHGSPSLTRDVDICHARDPANLERLSKVLVDLHAHLRGVDEDVPFLPDARTLRAGGSFTFITDAGDLDILATPAGIGGFDELAVAAEEINLGDFRIKVAALSDLIRMKRAAARPKDLIEVEILSALRDEIDGR
jgi:predicted nucleotidyltransferase